MVGTRRPVGVTRLAPAVPRYSEWMCAVSRALRFGFSLMLEINSARPSRRGSPKCRLVCTLVSSGAFGLRRGGGVDDGPTVHRLTTASRAVRVGFEDEFLALIGRAANIPATAPLFFDNAI